MVQIHRCLLVFLIVVATIPSTWVTVEAHGNKAGFYCNTFPRAEDIFSSTIEEHVKVDRGLAPGLLSLHFHNCFVQGCDGSILISGPPAERSAPPNLGLRGFQVIDGAKTKLEAEYPGVIIYTRHCGM